MVLAQHAPKDSQRRIASRHIFANRAVALLDQVEGLIRGYVFIWGDPQHVDAFKTWFDRARPPETATNDGMHVRPIFYEHTMDKTVFIDVVGRIDAVGFDDVGMWYTGHLYRSSPYFGRIVSELRAKKLKTSSGSTESALWRADGSFFFWPLGELSLTENPAEKRIPATVLVRAQERHEVSRRGDAPALPLSTHTHLERRTGDMPPELQALIDQLVAQGMSEEDIMKLIQQILQQQAAGAGAGNGGGEPPAAPADVPVPELALSAPQGNPAATLAQGLRSYIAQRQAETERTTIRSSIDQLTTAVEEMRTAQQQAEEARRNAPPPPTQRRGTQPANTPANITGVRDLRHAHLTPSDMWFIRSLLADNGEATSEEFNRAMAHKTFDDLSADKLMLDAPYRSTMRSMFKRADDFMASDIAGQGQEWSSIWYASEIWEKARHEVELIAEMTSRNTRVIEVPDGAKTATVFLEGADMIWHTTAQANDKDATGRPETVTNLGFVGTDSVDVAPGELTAAAAYTDILAEDSLIPIANQLNMQFQLSALEVIEATALNGDVVMTASTNINLIDGTPAGGLDKPYYLVSDGILKLPLVTNTALWRDALGVLNENLFQANVQKLPRTVRSKKKLLLHVMDVDTYEACLVIPALKTKDVADDYTLRTGELRPIFGVKPLASGQMVLANSAGKVPAAGGTLGRVTTIYCPYWALVWKRQVSFENARFALAKTNVIVGSLRMAMRRRSNDAASLSSNVPVSVAA